MKILLLNKLELEMKLYMKSKCVQYKMAVVGFEPTPPKKLVPKNQRLRPLGQATNNEIWPKRFKASYYNNYGKTKSKNAKDLFPSKRT